MIEPVFSTVLRKLYSELAGSGVNWAVTGSLSFAREGLPLTPHDIDIPAGGRARIRAKVYHKPIEPLHKLTEAMTTEAKLT